MNGLIDQLRQSHRAISALALLFICSLAFFWRVYFPFDHVFHEDWVRFQLNDSWHHMRVVENLVQHFPYLVKHDPYGLHPGGQSIHTAPFYDLLLGSVIWLLGTGSPSTSLIEKTGAFFPPVLGTGVTLVVYFIGKELFNRAAGLLAAALLAILPGQFLLRSLLGFTDHHIAEVLFSSLAILFLILAIKSSRSQELSLKQLRRQDRTLPRRTLVYSLLTGISLGLYLLSWTGGTLFVLIITSFIFLQNIFEHCLRKRSADYLGKIGEISFLVALVLIAPAANTYPLWNVQLTSLIMSIVFFVMWNSVSKLMIRRKIRGFYYPLVLTVLVSLCVLVLWVVYPSLVDLILSYLYVLKPGGNALTVTEMRGISIENNWGDLTTVFYLSLISLPVIGYRALKEADPTKTLLFVWCLAMLLAAFGQLRFSYYFAVNASLLVAFISWKILEFAGIKEIYRESLRAQLGSSVVALAIVFFLVFYPHIGRSVESSRSERGPTESWHNVLTWMSQNTPEPFENPNFYNGFYSQTASEADYDSPNSAYGVMSWWDFGYWITYIAHRIPNTNPGTKKAELAASYFTGQHERSANEILNAQGTRYVIVDQSMAQKKFHAMIQWGGAVHSEFVEPYYRSQAGRLIVEKLLFYPKYYQSICSRLYHFNGEMVTPHYETWVVSFKDIASADGENLKELAGFANGGKPFATYEEALAFVEQQDSMNYRVVGTDPRISPVPLEKLKHYKLVCQSPPEPETTTSMVKVFEYTP